MNESSDVINKSTSTSTSTITCTKQQINSHKEFNAGDSAFFAYEDGTPDVTVTMSVLVLDAIEIMEHLKVVKYHTIIGKYVNLIALYVYLL